MGRNNWPYSRFVANASSQESSGRYRKARDIHACLTRGPRPLVCLNKSHRDDAAVLTCSSRILYEASVVHSKGYVCAKRGQVPKRFIHVRIAVASSQGRC